MSDSQPATPIPPSPTALKQPLFRRYFVATCMSTMGTWISRFLLGWSAWELTHAALWVGITSAMMLLPTFILSPLFGVVSDRVSPRNGLLATLSSQGALAALAALAIYADWFSIAWLLGLAIALGAITAAHQPLRLALIPRLVPREAMPSAIGVSAIVFNTSRILGPAAAGWLLAHSNSVFAFSVSAGLFGGAGLALLRVRGIYAAPRGENGSMLEQLRAGLRFARRHDTIRLALLCTVINGLLGRTVIELLPALSGKLLDGRAASLAVLTACAGAGSILGGLLLTRFRSDEHALSRMVLFSLAGSSLVLFASPLASGLWPLATVVLGLSLATTTAGTGTQAMAQLSVPDEYRGRVLSLWTVCTMGAPAVGSFVMGALADSFGFALVLLAFALGALVLTALAGSRTDRGSQ